MTDSGRARLRLALVLGLAALLYLPAVWTRDLWNPDEPRYAEATREMIATGNYVLPRLNGEPYYEKPPLFFWLSAAAEALPGVPQGSGGRVVSAGASTGTAILTWRIGAMIMGEATGALAALLLATTLLFWDVGQTGVIDPTLTFFCTLAIYGFARRMLGRPRGILLFYAACSLGVLAKGPVALILPALAAILFTVLHRGPGALKARHPLWGLALVALPVALWIAAGAAGGGGREFVETMLIRQNVGRALDAYIHKEPFYYFLPILPLALLPWSVFLPQALVATFKEKVCGVRPMLLPFAWFVTTLVFFSLVSSKKTRYLLPLCPAAALLVAGWMMRRLLESSGRVRQGRAGLGIAAAVGLAVAAALGWASVRGPSALPAGAMAPLQAPGSEAALAAVTGLLTYPGSLRLLVPAILLAAACAGACGLLIARRGEALMVFMAGWVLALASGSILWTPVVDEMKSARPFAEAIRGRSAGEPLFYLESIHEGAINFYLPAAHIPLVEGGAEFRRARATPRALFIASVEDLRRTERKEDVRFERDVCRRVGSRILCLVRVAAD